jgi:hypothetical protein
MTHGFYNSEMGYYAGPSSTPMPAPHVGVAGVFTSNTPVGAAGYFGTPYRPPTAPPRKRRPGLAGNNLKRMANTAKALTAAKRRRNTRRRR